jgi:hypothetical protein
VQRDIAFDIHQALMQPVEVLLPAFFRVGPEIGSSPLSGNAILTGPKRPAGLSTRERSLRRVSQPA